MTLTLLEKRIFRGIPYVTGAASATLLAADLELSFWGGVDPRTGEIIDRFHPLSGRFLKDTILAIPGGRGSCGGSVIMMELILHGLGLKALIFERREEIIILGVMVAEESFNKTAAVVTLTPKDFCEALGWDGNTVLIRGELVSDASLKADSVNGSAKPAIDLNKIDFQLTDADRAVLDGATQELMDVGQAHVDGAWYGSGSIAFGQRLRDWGGKSQVPTTINALNVDQKRWRVLGITADFGSACDEMAKAFVDMGGKISFTCAPYLLDNIPRLGDPIAWGQSNAVIYANSVLGYALGAIATTHIPVITGLKHLKPSKDDFKAFSAAFATYSSAPTFHMVNLTPEAPTLEAVCANGMVPKAIDVDSKDLYAIWNEFNHGSEPREINLVSFGNPYFSCREIKEVARLCQGKTKKKKKDDVSVIVTCGRARYGLASQAGYVGELEKFGVQSLQDTCRCSIEEPVIPKYTRTIMTNSGNYIHYGPGITGRQFAFGTLEMCVDAACTGKTTGDPPSWLQGVRST
ncbi:hypothetical protein ASPFODRAFT_29281 [Aspergillus luchuensis CBS 106.47]|uniref:Aconitase X catalytic domain-containing protein n=1 Tax=Aspergillus luchuensis (strain CBS 106.47) TaxID=1137211 RepID=A0A1M3TVE9_ASPLC|nr:hypothetical protein ASPFODRAFT_29281 [Aspergillus luchuensis CBS 106.47]